VTRVQKRDRKIIVVIESDLYSDEVFAVTPFYDEGDAKNQLQSLHFNLELTETSGEVKAKVSFGNCLSHFTKGHSQLHSNLSTFFIDKKDCARNWFLTEKEEWFKDERITQILKLWETDNLFHAELSDIAKARKMKFKNDRLTKAKLNHQKSLDELECAVNDLTNL
jgi:hypothetical protein